MMATAAKKTAGKAEGAEPKRKEAEPPMAGEINLAGFSSQGLRQLAREVEQELNRRRVEDREIRELAASYGFTVEEVLGTAPKKSRRASAPAQAKYRNPDDPEQTWAGRGRKPGWLVAALAQGKTLEDLEFFPGQTGEFF
jgi:DNA-binding protein H-NS